MQDAGGHQYFTRDGIFNIDSAGNLVTQNGMKVVGAKSIYSNSGSDKTVKIPKNMLAVIEGDPNVSSVKIEDLNNASITSGKVSVDITDTSGNVTNVLVDIPSGDQAVSKIVSNFNDALSSYGINFTASNGTISYTNSGSYTMSFSSSGTTSNFLAETGLASSTTSSLLNEVVTLQDMVNYNDPNAVSLKSTAIDEHGIVVATYNDGSILTQYVDEAQILQWKYTTSDGVTISGSDVTAQGASISNSYFPSWINSFSRYSLDSAVNWDSVNFAESTPLLLEK